MRLLVFAHTPPPFHGQSYMVKLMLDGLQRDPSDLQIFHVNARVSATGEEIGSFTMAKLFLLLKYCLTAVRLRFQTGTDTFYYVPAPGKRSAIYRDWVVMILCRPFFRTLILHWHAVGLSEWIATRGSRLERTLTRALIGRADLSIVLSEFAITDAQLLQPRRIAVVANGIPDPCPDYEATVCIERQKRAAKRHERALQVSSNLQPYDTEKDARLSLLFLAACTEEKGIFASLEAVALAREKIPWLTINLIVAGDFVARADRERFDQRISRSDLAGAVIYVGFVGEERKYQLLRESDCLLFPSVYPHEGQPVSIIEAMAFGLPVIASAWRGIPEMLPRGEGKLIAGQTADAIANAIAEIAAAEATSLGRERFLERFRAEAYWNGLWDAFRSVSKDSNHAAPVRVRS